MADTKYGQLFTKQDLGEFVEALERLQNEHATLGRYPEDVIVDKVLAEMRGFRLPPAEPLFVLRAQDKAATDTIDHYWTLCEREGSPEAHLDAISLAYSEFTQFSTDNPDRMKVAD